MITTEELRLVYLEKINDACVELTLPRSPDDWAHRRAAAVDRIRRTDFIPDVLLNLVLVELKERTPVKLKFRVMPGPFFKVEVEEVDIEIDPSGELELRCRQMGDPAPARMPYDLENVMPASEAIALLLLNALRLLKYAERRSSAKARSNPHLIPRSTISDVAVDLLQRCEWNYPPGETLIDLFRDLLNLENPKAKYPRRMDARQRAANILARNPEIAVSELATAVGVNKSSVSRWLKESDFRAMVDRSQSKS